MRITCPHCNQPYEAEPEHVGQSVHCDSCDKDFTISAPTAPAKKTGNLIKCPDCERMVSASAKSCPSCGAALESWTGNIPPYNPGRPIEYHILNVLGLMTLIGGFIASLTAALSGNFAALSFCFAAIITGAVVCGFASIISATYRTEKITGQLLEKLKK